MCCLQGPVRALAVDATGHHLVTAGADGQVRAPRQRASIALPNPWACVHPSKGHVVQLQPMVQLLNSIMTFNCMLLVIAGKLSLALMQHRDGRI